MSAQDPPQSGPSRRERRPEEITVSIIAPGVMAEVGRRRPLPGYLSELWQRRHFIVEESKSKVASDARSNLLGHFWLILNPLLSGLVFYAIFGVILNTAHGIDNFVGFLVIGVFHFQFTVRSLQTGAGSIRAGRAMIRSFYFPRAALPIATTIREIINFIPAFLTMLALILVIPPMETITWHTLWIFPCFLVQVLLAQGLAFGASRLCFHVPDFSNIISFIARFWLYASGVFFSIDRLVNAPQLAWIMKANPMYAILEINRNAILYGTPSDWWLWVVAGGWALVAFVGGFLYCYFGEERYGRP